MNDAMMITVINGADTFIAGEGLAVSVKDVSVLDITTALNFIDVTEDGQIFKKAHKSVDIIGKVTLAYRAGYDLTFTTTLAAMQTPTVDSDMNICLSSLKDFITNDENDNLFGFDFYNPSMLINPNDAIEVTAHTPAVIKFLEDNDMINYTYPPDVEENEIGYHSRQVKVDCERVDWFLSELQRQLEGSLGDKKTECNIPLGIPKEIMARMKSEAIISLRRPILTQ